MLLVDDHADVRFLLRMILEETEDLAVVGEADGLDPAVAGAAEADVAIVDHRMPIHDGFEVCQALLERHPELVVIICSSLVDERLETQALEAGAAACVPKDDFERLPEIVRELLLGRQA